MKKFKFIASFFITIFISGVFAQRTPEIVKAKSGEFQLVVNEKPFLMLGGEVGNSAVSDTSEMKAIWPKLKTMNLNTVLVPVYWELLEPQEGKFDFTLVDAMIKGAREHQLRLVLLWFGTWKNSMSCYTPAWVKTDYIRFPRTLDINRKPTEIVSAFSENILKADINAYTSLLKHIKTIDIDQTVIMIQVENEIGQLPDARDYSALANKAFQAEVPKKLTDYLLKNKNSLLPHLKNLWNKNGDKTTGNWETVFGKSLATDEIFMAWYFAYFANKVAEAGKLAYNLPVYVNCALNRPGVEPGKYPSGGPLPHLIDIWHAAAPQIDMLSPDVYHGDFRQWLAMYNRKDNPVFLPEIKMEAENASQVFFAIGRHKSLGYCPFAIETASENESIPLSKSYSILSDISELILTHRASSNGVYLDKQTPRDTLIIGNYQLIVSHVCTLPWTDGAKVEKWNPAGCVIIQSAPGEFWIAGTGIALTFKNVKNTSFITGILSADIAEKNEQNWKFIRLNGDQTHQGRHVRIGSGEWQIQKVILYDYK